MLLTTIQMLLNPHPPSVHLFHQVNRHIPQPRHVHENVTYHSNRLLNRLINVHSRVTLQFHPILIRHVFFSHSRVLFWKKCQKFSWFCNVPTNFIYTLSPPLNSVVNHMIETLPVHKGLVLFLQPRSYYTNRLSLQFAEQRVEIKRRMILQIFLYRKHYLHSLHLRFDVSTELYVA